MSKRDNVSRIDALLVERGLFGSREKAQAAVLAGEVLVNETAVTKCGAPVPRDAEIRVKSRSPYVGRGAYKLIKALDEFRIDAAGKTAVDVGASTGGFTQVLLERGASLVYAVDVGDNQLDWKLRSDPRVRSMEHTNARRLDPSAFDPKPSVAVMDVSFISVTKVLEAVAGIMTGAFVMVVLIKPQFELEPGLISKGGFVEEKYRGSAVKRVTDFAAGMGLTVSPVIESPITGAKSGNVEFLVSFTKT